MTDNDQMLTDHRAAYGSFVKLSAISSVVVALALILMAVFLL